MILKVFAELEAAFKRELRVKDETDSLTIDLKKREELIELVKSNEKLKELKFPILTFDNHVINDLNKEQTALICFYFDIIQVLKEKFVYKFFVSPQIARQCPYLVGAMPKASYLTSGFKIKLEHLSNNLEYTNENLNTEFRRVLRNPDVQVIKANYLPIWISYANLSLDELVYNNFKFAIFDYRLVVIPCRNVADQAFVMLIILALKELLKANNIQQKYFIFINF